MHRYLLASTAILALAAPVAAETISTAVTQPVRTSTIKDGSADSITIASGGSVKPASGTAVTIDSNHGVTNQGTIAVDNASGAIGIQALAGTSGDIVNAGTITIDEPYTPTDTDNDGDLDGPFALGNNRFGIRTEGAHTGNLSSSGTITVEGNDSAGIWLGGALAGNIVHDGKTSVLGDRSVAVHAGPVAGNVRLAGQVSAQGLGAIGAHFSGDITGALVIQGTVAATGYRVTTAPAGTSKLDADDLLQGGPGVLVEGSVGGGIVVAVPPKDNSTTDNDEDDDGIEDAKEGAGAITSIGAAPALAIGATDRAITLGPVAGTADGFGLIVEGTIGGQGVHSGVAATGLAIGGRGGAVSIANGMAISGTVQAVSNGASATGLLLGNGASVAQVRNSGTISAAGGNATAAHSTAVLIDSGAQVPVLRNSGTIRATAAGADGSATAILDRSGALALVENSGTISGTGADVSRNVAIDLRANTSGVIVRQTAVASGVTAPSITGKVLLGSGNDLLELADGAIHGEVAFGAGNNSFKLSGDAAQNGTALFGGGNDVLSLADTAKFTGNVDFGGGAGTLNLTGSSAFSGNLWNAGGVAVEVAGGSLNVTNAASIASLAVGKDGVLVATLDKDAGQGTFYDVAGTASFADGATLALKLGEVSDAEGRYTILRAGSITGLADVETSTALLPFMFKGTIATDAPANTVAVDVSKRTAQELGLNRSQSSAYNALFAAIGADDQIEDVFLEINDGNQFRGAVRQMLPDHAGAAFEGISLGSRTFARQVADARSPVYVLGGVDVLISSAGWSSNKDEGATAAYDLGGFGFSASGEVDTRVGSFGLSGTWFWNDYDDGTEFTNVESNTYELGAYWRGQWGGLSTFARASIGRVNFDGRRRFSGTAGGKTIQRDIASSWNGTMMGASGGLAYEGRAGSLFFRPAVSVDYLKLDEDGYTDTGGEGLDLTVEDRKSDEFAANGGLTIGLDFIGRSGGGQLMRRSQADNRWFRVEGEGGWREILGGTIGSTTARFEGGPAFTIDPDQTESGWYGRLRAVGGGSMFEIGAEAGAEDRNGRTAMSLRGTVRLGF
jgi:hypothetical protein